MIDNKIVFKYTALFSKIFDKFHVLSKGVGCDIYPTAMFIYPVKDRLKSQSGKEEVDVYRFSAQDITLKFGRENKVAPVMICTFYYGFHLCFTFFIPRYHLWLIFSQGTIYDLHFLSQGTIYDLHCLSKGTICDLHFLSHGTIYDLHFLSQGTI